jgi:hypothetical protein
MATAPYRQFRERLRAFEWSKSLRELVVVVAGILIALALDEWMTGRRDRAEEELLLRAVQSEFQAMLTDMDRELVFRNAMIANTDRFFTMAASGERPDPATMDEMLGDLMWWSSMTLSTGASQSILVGGKLRLIENEEIRYFLAALPERLSNLKQNEQNDYIALRDTTAPYFLEHADMAQILRTVGDRPGSGGKDERWFRYEPKAPRNDVVLFEEPRFMGIVSNVFASQGNVIAAYEGLRPDLVRMIALIDKELAD